MKDITKKRIYSLILDMIVSNLFGTIVASSFNFEQVLKIGELDFGGLNVRYGFSFSFIFLLLYFVFFDVVRNGETIGKKLFSILVVDEKSFTKLSIRNNLKRTFLKTIAICLFPISILLFVFQNGITIHDRFSKTLTISKKDEII